MRKTILGLLCLASSAAAHAQMPTDTTTFKGRLYNKEYNIYISMDAYHKNVRVPDQDVFGELPGFLGDNQDSRKWLFIDSELVASDKLSLTIVNDYGSEDLTATLTHQPDGTYVLKQQHGSALKVARNSKWTKLPKVLTFSRQQ